MFYPLGSVPSYQPQSQPAQLNGVVQHDEILQNLTPTNNNIAVNNVNNNTNAHNPIQLQSQSLTAQQQIIPDQLANVTGTQNATLNNDLDNATSPAIQNDIEQQNDVTTQASQDIETKDDLPLQLNEQNNVNNDEALSKATQNEPKTYAQFFKSDNFSINFSSTATSTSGRSPNTANTLNSSRSASSRPGQVRGKFRFKNFFFFFL